jgi:hypothetical protein
MDLTEEEKGMLYDAGFYSFPPPPVHTRLWDRNAWIRFIDREGVWNTLIARLQGVIE